MGIGGRPFGLEHSVRLTADHVTIERGGRLVIDDLAFSAAAGTALVITGPNGAGKSTLLRAIAGLVQVSAGRIRLDGGDPERTLPEQCHYFGHLDGLKTALTVSENVAFWRDYYGAPVIGNSADALAAVGLDDLGRLPAAYLSAGQRRRLSFARLIVAHRPIWLLDEPTSALDAASEARFVDLANRHLATGGLVVAATHAPLGLTATTTLRLGQKALT
jgi:heme exporter protein A